MADQNVNIDGADALARPVDRAFTCTLCGYATTHEAGRLQADFRATCLNCGDWTVQSANTEELIATAREIAELLADPILTERQALAYLLREHVGIERRAAAAAMESTPSNVDNLHRRGREKVTDARRIVGALDALQVDGDGTAETHRH